MLAIPRLRAEDDDLPRLLTLRHTAQLLGVSYSVVTRMANRHQLEGLVDLPGRRRRVKRDVLLAWLAGRE